MEMLILLAQSAAWFGVFLIRAGVFLIGIAAIWFVSVYVKKEAM